jgi:hypothetical protein
VDRMYDRPYNHVKKEMVGLHSCTVTFVKLALGSRACSAFVHSPYSVGPRSKV